MTLVCRPPGRGNWTPVFVEFRTPMDLFRFKVGDVFNLCGITLRVAEIRP